MSIRRFLVVESHSLMVASSDVFETVTSETWLKFRDETVTSETWLKFRDETETETLS